MTYKDLYLCLPSFKTYSLLFYVLGHGETLVPIVVTREQVINDTGFKETDVDEFFDWATNSKFIDCNEVGCGAYSIVLGKDISKIKLMSGKKPSKKEKSSVSQILKTKEDIERRKSLLKSKIDEYAGRYDEDLLRRFFLYWGESDDKTGLLRYEKEGSWELEGRLETFARNRREWSPGRYVNTIEEKQEVFDAFKKPYENFVKYISEYDEYSRFLKYFDLDTFKKIRSNFIGKEIMQRLDELNESNWNGENIIIAFGLDE